MSFSADIKSSLNSVLPNYCSFPFRWQKVQAISPPSAARRNALQLERRAQGTSQHCLSACIHTCRASFNAAAQWYSHHFPLFQRRQEKAQNKLPTLKWKMFLRQLIGSSLHLHICYLRVVHLFALRQLFLITLCPLLLEGNIFNQINLKTMYFVCLRVAERKRGLKKKAMKSLYVQSIAAPAAQAQGVPKAASGWQSFPCRAAHQEQANRTNIPTLWISGGLSQTWPLEIQSRGFFFFVCVCASQFHG